MSCSENTTKHFGIKRRAKEEGSKGLEAIAELCINGPTGKWGFNTAKQKSTQFVTKLNDFYHYLWVLGESRY